MTKTAGQEAGTDLAKRYEPTPEERAAMTAHFNQKKGKAPAPRIKLNAQGGTIGQTW